MVAALSVSACGQEAAPSADVSTRPDVADTGDAGSGDVADLGSDAPDGESDSADSTEDPRPDPNGDTDAELNPPRVLGFSPSSPFVTRGPVAFEVLLDEPSAVDTVIFQHSEAERVDERAPFSWATSGQAEGEYRVAVTAENSAGSADADFVYIVDRTPPVVTLVEPGATMFGPVEQTLFVELLVDDASPVEVRLSLDETEVATGSAPPWVFEVPTQDFGEFPTLTVVVTDHAAFSSSLEYSFANCGVGAFSCDGSCIEESAAQSSIVHCGGCFLSCVPDGEECVEGACQCLAGYSACSSGCVALGYDPENCGTCGTSCAADEVCNAGTCGRSGEIPSTLVPGGEMSAGVPPGTLGRAVQDVPREIRVTRPFTIDRTEVTQGMWLEQFEVNPSEDWDCGANCPVEMVTWWDAVSYANARSDAEGLARCYELIECNSAEPGNGLRCASFEVSSDTGSPLDCEGFRLPTEAEWELAARAGVSGETYAGDIASAECDDLLHLMAIGWFACNSSGPHPVAELEPNPWGLFDTSGNVFEWIGDYWASEFDETEFVDPIGPDEGIEHPIKGGSWSELPFRLRPGSRLSELPHVARPDLGFRLARSVPE